MLEICIFLGLVGTAQAKLEGFIVGGEYASINRYPHSAFLTVACVSDEPNIRKVTWVCGSSIINQRLLLTAGHCVYSCGDGTRIIIHMGDENRQNGVLRSSTGFILHEKYNSHSSSYDIAMVRMTKPVAFSSRISRVAIMNHPPYGEPANLAGWGLTNEKTRASGVRLKSLDQKVWRHASCQKMFGILPRGTICASSKQQQNFAAQGDSGSGLVVRGYIQIGLVSYKIPQVANNVIIYTDVGYYYNWIIYNANRLFCFKQTVI